MVKPVVQFISSHHEASVRVLALGQPAINIFEDCNYRITPKEVGILTNIIDGDPGVVLLFDAPSLFIFLHLLQVNLNSDRCYNLPELLQFVVEL